MSNTNVFFFGSDRQLAHKSIDTIVNYFTKKEKIHFSQKTIKPLVNEKDINNDLEEDLVVYESEEPRPLKLIDITNKIPESKHKILENYKNSQENNIFVCVFTADHILKEQDKISLKKIYTLFKEDILNNFFCIIDKSELNDEEDLTRTAEHVRAEVDFIFKDKQNSFDFHKYQKRVFFVELESAFEICQEEERSPLEESSFLNFLTELKSCWEQIREKENPKEEEPKQLPEPEPENPLPKPEPEPEPEPAIRMSIDNDINAILTTRRPVAERIKRVKTHLGQMYSMLNELDQKQSQITGNTDDQELVSRLNVLDFSKIQVLIMNQLAVLDKVQMRFNRQSLNLAVVARAKQGKSRLLRSFTGLSENEIADGDRGHCTGIASTIYPNLTSSETYGKVWFHTPTSFLTEIITPYYQKLNLGAVPNIFSDFKKTLPPLPSDLANSTNTIYQEMYRYLERYHTNLREYEHLLGRISPDRVERADIRKYVAQYDLNGNPTYDYMAVQKCNIFCPFPNAPTDKIAVVDTQGLGDTGVGDEERLIKVLGENVDIILFIRMPHPNADAWRAEDINLYSVANRALANHLPLEKWSFLVLNQTDDSVKGNNSAQCNILRNQVPESIRVIDIITANCADETEANTKILEPIIKGLVGQIEKLDREYVTSYQQELNNLQAQIHMELEKAHSAFSQQILVEDRDEIFEELFEEFWETLTVGLDQLISNLRKEAEAEDNYFLEQVEHVTEIARNDTAIPSDDANGKTALEQIEIMILTKVDEERAYSEYLDIVRTHLTHHFLALDDGLNRSIEQAKAEVAKLFLEELNFSGLTDKRGAEFIQAMAELLPDKILREQKSQLKQGFQILAEYKLSFKGLILPRIRPCLKDLNPFPRKIPLEATNRQDAQEQILYNLQTLHGEALFQSEGALNKMLGEPVQAALAIIEEFKDQVVNTKKIKTEWRLFLQREKARIWFDEFGQGDSNMPNQKDWQDSVQRAIESNLLDNFQFMN